MKNLFYRLILFLDTANESDINYAIALYLANHFYEISNMRISELASECYVSPATISRFCRALGYENFAHLKQECYSFHSNDKKFNNLINISPRLMREEPAKATANFVEDISNNLHQLNTYLNWDDIDQVLAYIHDYDNVVFFGTQFSQSAALHFQTDLLMLEKYTICYLDVARQEEYAKTLDENSVAIVITVNGYYGSFRKVMQYIKKAKCKVVLITCNPKLDLDLDINIRILLGDNKTNRTGKHNLLSLMELMSLRYYSLYCPSLDELLKRIV